jgi:AraC-like DNA-binding protein
MPDGEPGAPAPAELTPGMFSTSGLPAARRVGLWESHNAAALIGLAVSAPDSLDAAELNVQLPRARLARVTGSAHSVERTRETIGRGPADSVAVFLTLRGRARFSADGVTLARGPGDAVAWETDRPFARTFAAGLEELVVTVPWADLGARTGVTGIAAGGRAAGRADPVIASFGGPAASASGSDSAGRRDHYARALARIAGRATRAERPLRPDEPTVLDLVAAIVAGPRAAGGAARRAVARAYIEERLADPNLGAAEIAAAACVSERQLSRLFAADGGSVPQHILGRRLQLAHSILSAPGAPTVAEVAARCGFTSAAYFSHAFRQRFGHRAGDLRT